MGATMVCRVGGGAGGGARAVIRECPGVLKEAWRNGPVKGEGTGHEFTVLKVGYSQTRPVPIILIPLSHGPVKVGSNGVR